MAVISEKQKFVFIHIPKTGGTSITECLSDTYRSGGFHSTAKNVESEIAWEQYFSFAFVRNPWDRMLSAFWMVTKGIDGMAGPPPAYVPQRGTRRRFSFYQFVESFHGIQNFTLDQLSFIDDAGRRLVNFVGRFETLERDFQKVCQIIGIEASLPRLNPGSHSHYQDYYNTDTRNLIAIRYAEEIDTFGYVF